MYVEYDRSMILQVCYYFLNYSKKYYHMVGFLNLITHCQVIMLTQHAELLVHKLGNYYFQTGVPVIIKRYSI